MNIMELREIMKAYTAMDEEFTTDQQAGFAQPPMDKGYVGAKQIALPKDYEKVIRNNNFLSVIESRSSRRNYSTDPLNLTELSFLLWATQGVKMVIGKKNKATLRTVPSAGARHPLETYLFINYVEGLEAGLYHYLALEHKLEYLGSMNNQIDRVTEAYSGQSFVGASAVTFVWTAIPYRTEWRYATKAQKYALLDAGHVAQNLYLACEAIGLGTCAIGAYDQALADGLLQLSTEPSDAKENEFVIYAASVGRPKEA